MRNRHSPPPVPGLLAAFGLLVLLQCAAIPVMTAGSAREVHLKVVVDPLFALSAVWRGNVRTLVDNASRVFASDLDVRFVIDTMIVWDLKRAPLYGQVDNRVCLFQSIPTGTSDIVVYFGKEHSLSTYYLGQADVEFGYVYVVQLQSQIHSFENVFLTLVHELAHVFGGVHVYPDKVTRGTLNFLFPYTDPEREEQVGDLSDGGSAFFDRPNLRVMQTLARRGFHDGDWEAGSFGRIERAYRGARQEGNPWRIRDGILENYELDLMYEEDPYHFLASFASLTGNDSAAIVYYDSLRLILGAEMAACVSTEGSITSKLCERWSVSTRTASTLLATRRAGVLLDKSVAYLRWGREERADSCVDAFMEAMPTISPGDKQRVLKEYAIFRDYFRRRRHTVPLPGSAGSDSTTTVEDLRPDSAATADTAGPGSDSTRMPATTEPGSP